MSWIDALRFRLRTVFDRERLSREMEDEVRFHLSQDARYESGRTDHAARLEAQRRLGNLTAIHDDRRRASGLVRVDRLAQDVRHAIRQLTMAPGFTLVVMLTLGLGIGANATMFSVIDRVMLRAPEGIVDPARVLQLRSWEAGQSGRRDSSAAMSYPSVQEFSRMTDAFSGVTGIRGPMDIPFGRGTSAANARGALVAGDYFGTLGVRPALGRFFADGASGGGERVAVVSHGFWQRQFGGQPDAIGRTLTIGTAPYVVIGVAPRGFGGHTLSATDFWLPVRSGARDVLGLTDIENERGFLWLTAIVRLRAGVTPAQAVARVSVGWQAWNVRPGRGDDPAPTPYLVSLVPGASSNRPEYRVARLLAGVALLLAAITCANVANLLLARALSRRREIAVRLALGVSRARLTSLVFVDALLLAIGGGGAAVGVAWVAVPLVRQVLFAGSLTTAWPVDLRVAAFTTLLALATGLLAGVVPAIQASRPSLIGALRQGTRDGAGHRSRTRTALLVTQGALSIALLAGSGVFLRSLARVGEQHLGLDLERIIVADFPSRRSGLSAEAVRGVQEAMRQRALAIPGVESASFTVGVPFEGQYSLPLRVPGYDSIPGMARGRAPFVYAVSPGFFHTMGTRLVAGREFTEADVHGAAVALVNQRMARLIWPDRDAIGECFRIELRGPTPDCVQVIGIVEDVRRQALLEREAAPQYYLPLGQQPALMSELTLLVRATDVARVLPALRRAVQSIREDMPYVPVRTLAEAVAPELRPWRLGASVFGLFGALAWIVAALGTYSVIQFSVAQRRHELAVRVALGALRRDVLRLVTADSLRIGGMAAVAGVALVLAGGPFVAALLFETSPRDPAVLAGVVALLLATSLAASLVPAWRATRVDPVATLNAE